MQSLIVKHNKIDVKKIVYEDFTLASGDKHVVSKIWYQDNENTQPHTFYIQTSALKVHEVNDESIMLVLDKTELIDNAELFDKLDKLFLERIKKNEITKKYELKKTIYKSTSREASNNSNINVLEFNIGNCKFFSNDAVSKKFSEVKHLIKKGSSLKIIFEVDKIVVDIKKNFIFTNMILTQAQIKIVPNKIELSEYSFVDEESDSESKSLKIDGAMLDNYTEYMDAYKNSESDSEDSMSEKSKESEDSFNSEESESEESNESVDIGNFLKHVTQLNNKQMQAKTKNKK